MKLIFEPEFRPERHCQAEFKASKFAHERPSLAAFDVSRLRRQMNF
jgi:hypothetical protein